MTSKKKKIKQNLGNYNRLKFKLDSDCLLRFRSLEGTRTVPSPVVSEMITALFNRNFDTEMDESLVRKFAVQLLSMLSLVAIYNNDRKICIDKVFQLRAYPNAIEENENEDGGRYVFSIRTTMKPKYLTSYLYNILFEGFLPKEVESNEIEDTTAYINDLFLEYFKNLQKSSSKRENELS